MPAHFSPPGEPPGLGDLVFLTGADSVDASFAFLTGVDGADADFLGGCVDNVAEMLGQTGGAESVSECKRPAEMLEGSGRNACCTVND